MTKTNECVVHRHSRRGVVLVCVLVCLLVVTALLAEMTRSALRAQRRLKTEQALRQVEFQIDAGRNRAVYRLARDDTYSGETWRPRGDAFGRGNHLADVIITLESAPDGHSSVLQVSAEYPVGTTRSIRRTERFSARVVP